MRSLPEKLRREGNHRFVLLSSLSHDRKRYGCAVSQLFDTNVPMIIAFFVPPMVLIGWSLWRIRLDPVAFFDSAEVAQLVAFAVPLYPFAAMVVLSGLAGGSGIGILTAVYASVVYYPVMFVLLAIYLRFSPQWKAGAIGLGLCALPLAVGLLLNLAGVWPR